MITVLLVEDQVLVRAGFRMVVESQPDMRVIGEAGDGAGAVARRRTGDQHEPAATPPPG